jgi:ribose-phosphate pyrophosphokinase
MFSSAPPLNHYNLTLLGPPTMRGAIVFSGSSHPTLVDGICDRLGTKRGIAQLSKFANGETQVQIRASAHVPLALCHAHDF